MLFVRLIVGRKNHLFLGSRSERGGARRAPTKRVLGIYEISWWCYNFGQKLVLSKRYEIWFFQVVLSTLLALVLFSESSQGAPPENDHESFMRSFREFGRKLFPVNKGVPTKSVLFCFCICIKIAWDTSKTFWADTAPFKGHQARLLCYIRKSRAWRIPSGFLPLAWSSQDTITSKDLEKPTK